MVAFRPFQLCPPEHRPAGVPLSYPWMQEQCTEEQAADYVARGWTVLSDEEYDNHISALSDDLTAWQAMRSQLAVEAVVEAAREFGLRLIVNFAAENILLGITQDGKTGEVLVKMSTVIPALQAGSLYEAITQIKAIPTNQYDTKYITAARLLTAVNRIETYLGLPLSESL